MKKRNITILLAALAISLSACKKNADNQTNTGNDTINGTGTIAGNDILGNEKQCYLKVSEGDADSNGTTIRDSIIFSISKKGDSVKGVFDWKPYEKDTKLSTFKGVLKGNKGKALATTHAEGMVYNEELKFVLKDSAVTIYYGEMEEGNDGVWRYKNISNGYLSEHELKRVPCN